MKRLMILLMVVLGVGVMAGVGMAQSGSIEVRLTDSFDDIEEWECNGLYRSGGGSSDLELGEDTDQSAGCGPKQLVGMRFRNVQIPAGSRITQAYVQFSVDETDGGPTNVIIYAERNANAPAFDLSSPYNIAGRTPTTEVVKWTAIPLWNTTHVWGLDQRTPDLSLVIGEVVALPGWASGNAIVVIVADDPDNPSAGHRTAESVDGTSAEAPLLHVEYMPDPRAIIVAPIDWAYVDLALLEWEKPDPMNEGDTILCNVYFGSVDPNLIPGIHGSILVVENYEGSSTGDFGRPLDIDTVYYWRVDCIDPNNGAPVTTTGHTWSFTTTVPEEVIVTESEGSTDVSEQDRIINRDDYIITLSKDPVVPVSITITEINDSTNAKETMESYNGTASEAPLLDVTHSGGTAVSVRINSGADDLEQYLGSGVQNGSASSDLEFFSDGADQMIALRFNNVDIPQGATIDSALVEFVVDEVEQDGEVYGVVTGENVDDAPALVNTAFHISDRLAANPTIATSTFLWTAYYYVNDKVTTSDISSVIQEIVNRAGWTSGNSLVLFFTERVDFEADDIEFIDATDPWAARGSSTYELNSGNWQTGVTVTIAAIDDDVLETDPDLITLIATASSTDPIWDGAAVADVIVSVSENDCGAWLFGPYDFDENCVVDLADLAMMVADWMKCSMPNDTNGDCVDYR